MREDDLDHEEYDEDDERVATKFVSGASKKYQRVNRKKKASHRKSRRVSKRPVWEISSDSETEMTQEDEDKKIAQMEKLLVENNPRKDEKMTLNE